MRLRNRVRSHLDVSPGGSAFIFSGQGSVIGGQHKDRQHLPDH